MVIDKLVEKTKEKKNPCIVGLDPEWSKIPDCYKKASLPEAEVVLAWAKDIIDCVADVVPAVKPQMAFYEVYGAEGVRVFEKIVEYAHGKELIVIDDSKRNDIGNTARAYAYAHLSKDGPINADFLAVSPFLGADSIQPFLDLVGKDKKLVSKVYSYSWSKICRREWIFFNWRGCRCNIPRGGKGIKKIDAESLFSCSWFRCTRWKCKRYCFLF